MLAIIISPCVFNVLIEAGGQCAGILNTVATQGVVELEVLGLVELNDN